MRRLATWLVISVGTAAAVLWWLFEGDPQAALRPLEAALWPLVDWLMGMIEAGP